MSFGNSKCKLVLFSTVALLSTAVLTQCSSLKNTKIDERYGKRIAYVDSGEGSPTLVFESGMYSGMETWDMILDSIAHHTRVYAYNRPGYGRSNQKDAPHTVKEVAHQLHANLFAKEIPPPYILVGHAAGGLFMNMFARLYPEEVAGVVLIDPIHPDQYEYLKNNEKLLYDLLFDFIEKGQRVYEYDIVKVAAQEFKNARPFPDVPLTVLSAGSFTTLEGAAYRRQVEQYQEELTTLSPKGKRLVLKDSGHFVHRNSPKVTTSEILRMVQLVRKETE